jgi:streptogramin lyase
LDLSHGSRDFFCPFSRNRRKINMVGCRPNSGRGKKRLFFVLLAAFLLVEGCGDDDDAFEGTGDEDLSPNRAVVVNGISGSMATVKFSDPPQVTDNLGGIGLGPSANRVALLGQEAYVVNSGTFGAAENASVQVIDMSSSTVVRTIPLPDGESPWDIAIVSPDKVYVTNLYGDSVTILDPRLDGPAAIIGTIDLPAGSSPAGITVDGNRSYIANTGLDRVTFVDYGPATVSVIDVLTDTVVDADGDPANGEDTPVSISGLNPQDLAVDAEGNLWVVCTGDWASTFGVVDVVDLTTLSEMDSLTIGSSPGSIAVGNRVALVGDGAAASLFVIDITTRTVLQDETDPLVLTITDWSFVPEIVFDRSGEVAYALAFQDDKVFELLVTNEEVSIRAEYALAAGSGPTGLTLSYD